MLETSLEHVSKNMFKICYFCLVLLLEDVVPFFRPNLWKELQRGYGGGPRPIESTIGTGLPAVANGEHPMLGLLKRLRNSRVVGSPTRYPV